MSDWSGVGDGIGNRLGQFRGFIPGLRVELPIATDEGFARHVQGRGRRGWCRQARRKGGRRRRQESGCDSKKLHDFNDSVRKGGEDHLGCVNGLY